MKKKMPELKIINRLIRLIRPHDSKGNNVMLKNTLNKLRGNRNEERVEVEYDMFGDDISDSDTMPLDSKFHHKYSC